MKMVRSLPNHCVLRYNFKAPRCVMFPVSSPPVSLAMGLSPRYHTGMLTSPIELPSKQEADDGKYW
jgi:hypothetical protein